MVGSRYAVAVGWYAGGGRAPEPLARGFQPPRVATVRFLQAADSAAAAALEAAAGQVCTRAAQGLAPGGNNLRLASLHRRCVVGDPTPTPAWAASDVPKYQFVWVTIERPPARLTLALPPGISEAGPNGKVVLCRGAGAGEGGVGVEGAASVAEWASGYLPHWPN